MSPGEWSQRLKLLIQEENEAAHEVAAWAVELEKLMMTSTPGSHRALKRYTSARDTRNAFLREVSFP